MRVSPRCAAESIWLQNVRSTFQEPLPMQCPVCQNVSLVMSERQGIEIDYCSQCRGVWLDRGELDKIIDRSQGAAAPAAPVRAAQPAPVEADRYRDSRSDGYGRKRKREGFLSEIFDFD
jgi:Zn-finger nucleic acid-binding protein